MKASQRLKKVQPSARPQAESPRQSGDGRGPLRTRGEAEMARLAKALGHPVRVKILRYLASRDSCMCGDIVEEVALAQSTVSQHLKVLKEAGLIKGEIDPPRICYCVDPLVVARFKKLIQDL